jgi:energy-coupling factor transport system ATP-binding protein
MAPVVKAEDLYFKYDEDSPWALEGVNLDINEGEWVALVGHNGSGKSTLAKLLNGILLPQEGKITLGEELVLNEETIWEIRKKIGMVFQNPDNQFVGTTVKDDVAFGLENAGVTRDAMIKRIEESLASVRMDRFAEHEPHHLSGGQKQRVAIAGILALQPSLMILDESTAMLDPQGRKEVIQTVRELQRQGKMSVLSITHELDEVLFADRVIVMNNGRKFAEGTPEEIFDDEKKLEAIGLDLPFTIKISKALKDSGINISKNHLTHEELVEELWKLHSRT